MARLRIVRLRGEKREGDQYLYDVKGEVVKIERYIHGELKVEVTEGL